MLVLSVGDFVVDGVDSGEDLGVLGFGREDGDVHERAVHECHKIVEVYYSVAIVLQCPFFVESHQDDLGRVQLQELVDQVVVLDMFLAFVEYDIDHLVCFFPCLVKHFSCDFYGLTPLELGVPVSVVLDEHDSDLCSDESREPFFGGNLFLAVRCYLVECSPPVSLLYLSGDAFCAEVVDQELEVLLVADPAVLVEVYFSEQCLGFAFVGFDVDEGEGVVEGPDELLLVHHPFRPSNVRILFVESLDRYFSEMYLEEKVS